MRSSWVMWISCGPAAALLPADAPALQRLRMPAQFFCLILVFCRSNINNYYDPENSYLNAVLARAAAFRYRSPCCGWSWPRAWGYVPAALRFRALHGQGDAAQAGRW